MGVAQRPFSAPWDIFGISKAPIENNPLQNQCKRIFRLKPFPKLSLYENLLHPAYYEIV